jgi:hypothetical protein
VFLIFQIRSTCFVCEVLMIFCLISFRLIYSKLYLLLLIVNQNLLKFTNVGIGRHFSDYIKPTTSSQHRKDLTSFLLFFSLSIIEFQLSGFPSFLSLSSYATGLDSRLLRVSFIFFPFILLRKYYRLYDVPDYSDLDLRSRFSTILSSHHYETDAGRQE